MIIIEVIEFESHLLSQQNNFELFFTYIAHEVSIVQGIKGLASGVFFENLKDSFLEVRNLLFVSVLVLVL